MRAPEEAPEREKATGSQPTSATTAGTAHHASAAGHEPDARRSGSVSPAASIAPPMRPAVYTPVTGPIRAGNRARTNGGSSAPATAMPIPDKADETYRNPAEGTSRSP